MIEGFGEVTITDNSNAIALAQVSGDRKSAADILREAAGGNKPETLVEKPKDPAEKTETGDKPTAGDQVSGTKEYKSIVEIDFNNVHKNTLDAPFYEAIKVKGMPEGVVPSYWVDDSGHYFYFKAKPGEKQIDKGDHWELENGTKFPKGKFHFSPFARKIEIEADNGGKAILDLAKAKQAADEAYQKEHGKPHGAYKTYAERYKHFETLQGPRGRNADPIAYMKGLSGFASRHIDADVDLAVKMAQNSTNPYMSIWASDLLLIKSMDPIIEQFRNGRITLMNDQNFVQMASPETRRRIQSAIQALEKISGDSDGNLKTHRIRANEFKPEDLSDTNHMPLHIKGYPTDNPKTYDERLAYFRFWGGSKDQAAHRVLQLRALDNVLSILNYVELPPANINRK